MGLILCVDVGHAHVGAAVVEPGAAHGAFGAYPHELAYLHTERLERKLRWRESDDHARRTQEVARFYATLIRKHGITRCLAELPHGADPASRAAVDLTRAQTALVAVLEVFNVAFEWYTPKEVKVAVTGKPLASKDQVMAEIERLVPRISLEFPLKAQREHVCDALGVWLAGRNGTLARL